MTADSRLRSAAVIIGTASYNSTGLPDLPSVRANVRGLHAMLTGEQGAVLRDEEVVVIEDPADPLELLKQIHECASVATDVFLVYYAGHGLRPFDTGRNELFLTTTRTDEEYPDHTALAFGLLRHEFHKSQARKRVLILDCCYSGLAVQTRMGPAAADLEVQGTYTMVSAQPDQASMAPRGATYTAFTSALLSVLREGLPDAPDPLPLAAVFPEVEARLKAGHMPPPSQFNTDTGGSIALTRNAQVASGIAPTPEAAQNAAADPAGDEDFGQRSSLQTLWRIWAFACLCFAFGPPTYLRSAHVAHPPPLLMDFQVTVMCGFLLAFLVGRYHTNVRVDADGIGIRFGKNGGPRYAWTAIAHVQIRARRSNTRRYDLWLALEPGIPGPWRIPFRRYNRYHKGRHEVRLMPLFGFSRSTVVQLDAALRRKAGSRWLPRSGGAALLDGQRTFHAHSVTWTVGLALAGLLTLPISMTVCFAVSGSWSNLFAGLIECFPVAVVALSLSPSLVPADLSIDTNGIRLRTGRDGKVRFLPWTSLKAVGVERSDVWRQRPGYLLVRFQDTPDAPPEVLLPLRRLWTNREEVAEALRRFGGHRWSAEIHRNEGVVQDDADAVVVQGHYHGRLSSAVLLGGVLVTGSPFRWLSSHLPAASTPTTWFASLYVLEFCALSYYLILHGPRFDRFTVRVDAAGLTRAGRWSKQRSIKWPHVRSVTVDENRVVLWPSAEGAANGAFRGLGALHGGFVLCRFTWSSEYVAAQPIRLKKAIARFAENRSTVVC
ncbi:caspase family protein [Streptomyces sp. NPDC003631]